MFQCFRLIFRFARFTWLFHKLVFGSTKAGSRTYTVQISFGSINFWVSNLRLQFEFGSCFPFSLRLLLRRRFRGVLGWWHARAARLAAAWGAHARGSQPDKRRRSKGAFGQALGSQRGGRSRPPQLSRLRLTSAAYFRGLRNRQERATPGYWVGVGSVGHESGCWRGLLATPTSAGHGCGCTAWQSAGSTSCSLAPPT